MKASRKKYLDWIVYQVYPRSFYDSDGDGIGDLNGVTKKLDYLCELGVNAVWLSPCYKSLNCDNGYDISDYRDIMDEFGTLDDWKRLSRELKSRNIKLIMDLVANHTSDEHPWFREARSARDNPYHDYYYWAETPPNDWQACFGGSAWEFNEATKEYYLHSFAVGQPDLNWTNPRVRKEIRDVVDFWVNMGVDGFRCDVLDSIAKDFDAGKMSCGPKLHEYIKELFGRAETKDIFTVGECRADEQSICEICGEDRGELTCVFQFGHFEVGRAEKRIPAPSYSIDEVKDSLVFWQNFTAEHELLCTLLTDNHDQPWYISRVGNDREYRYECATMYAAMLYLLKGIPFIYQGQEIGSVNSRYESIDDFDDVETLNYYYSHKESLSNEELINRINYGSRDNTRRPMAWTGGKNYGFTEGKPWLSLPTRGAEINVEKDRASDRSVFAFYQKVLKLRKERAAVRYGDFTDLTVGKGYFAYERSLVGETDILVICNFDRPTNIAIPDNEEYRILFSNSGTRTVPGGRYEPYETAVFEKTERCSPNDKNNRTFSMEDD